jgi:type I thyroxine 5'-deiodinase
MARAWADRADFVTVYIKEAHPTDEWQMPQNEDEDVCYRQPRSTSERVAIAGDFAKRFSYDLPLLVDPIEDPADAVYAGWPERLYVIGEDGRIAYKGEPGPFGYHPEEVEAWLEQWAGAGAPPR